MPPNRRQDSQAAYQVLARRFRPKTFGELVGQEAILETLRGALSSGRVPHAFLFAGSRGVGKTTMARILARCLNCETGVTPDPCGTCDTCRSILAGSNGDVMEIDAASHNLVDDIRELRDRVGFASMGARYKIYILDEVHMLTRSAFNAFLKTLEEPPPNVAFILATTELHKVPETIRSRCQVLLFARMGEADIVERLAHIARDEGLDLHDDVLLEIASGACGGMRDAETALERILPVALEMGGSFGVADYRRLVNRAGLDRVVEVVGSLLRGEAAPALHFAADLVATGVDERQVLGEILEILRALILLKVDGPDTGLVGMAGDLRQQLVELAAATELTRLDAMAQAGLKGRERIRHLDDRRLVLEISLLRMVEAGSLPQLTDLIEHIRAGTLPAPSTAATEAPGSRVAAPAGRRSPGESLKASLLAACEEKGGVLSRTLELCAVSGPDAAGVVAVRVETDRKLHRDRMQSPGVQEELKGLIKEILGQPVQLEVSLGRTPGAAPDPQAPANVGREVQPGPGVQRVLDRFDGKILNVDTETD